MAIDKCLSWKRSEQARGQDRDEWGRFCKVRRGSTSNDGSSTDATYTKDTSTDGRYSRGKSIDYGSSDGEYSGTFEIDSMSSEHQDRVVQECESSRKAKKMEEMDKAAVKKQKNRDAVGMGKSYYIDLISSDEEEMGPKPYLTASNWDKKRRDMENGTDKKGKKKTSDVKSSDKGGQEKGKKVEFTKKREIEKKMAATADKINLITVELAREKDKMKLLQRELAELDYDASDM